MAWCHDLTLPQITAGVKGKTLTKCEFSLMCSNKTVIGKQGTLLSSCSKQ